MPPVDKVEHPIVSQSHSNLEESCGELVEEPKTRTVRQRSVTETISEHSFNEAKELMMAKAKDEEESIDHDALRESLQSHGIFKL